jgi:phosphoenolpyruvate carboxylase
MTEDKIRTDIYKYCMVVKLEEKDGAIKCPGCLGQSWCVQEWFKSREKLRAHLKKSSFCLKVLQDMHLSYRKNKSNLNTYFDKETYNFVIHGIIPKIREEKTNDKDGCDTNDEGYGGGWRKRW